MIGLDFPPVLPNPPMSQPLGRKRAIKTRMCKYYSVQVYKKTNRRAEESTQEGQTLQLVRYLLVGTRRGP